MAPFGAVLGRSSPVLLQEAGQPVARTLQIVRVERPQNRVGGHAVIEAVNQGHEPLRPHQVVQGVGAPPGDVDPGVFPSQRDVHEASRALRNAATSSPTPSGPAPSTIRWTTADPITTPSP